MKTEAGINFAKHILSTAEGLEKMAKTYAVHYAQADKPEDKAMFAKYAFAAEQVRALHAPACNVMNAIESLMPAAQEQPQ